MMDTPDQSAPKSALRDEVYDLFDKSNDAYKAGDIDNGLTYGTLAGLVLDELDGDNIIDKGENNG